MVKLYLYKMKKGILNCDCGVHHGYCAGQIIIQTKKYDSVKLPLTLSRDMFPTSLKLCLACHVLWNKTKVIIHTMFINF